VRGIAGLRDHFQRVANPKVGEVAYAEHPDTAGIQRPGRGPRGGPLSSFGHLWTLGVARHCGGHKGNDVAFDPFPGLAEV